MSAKHHMRRGDGSRTVDNAVALPYHFEQPGDVDTVIRDRVVFDATVKHAARLHSVDTERLRTSLRYTLSPGEPVTAGSIYQCAAKLAESGLAPRRPEPAAEPSTAALQHEVREGRRLARAALSALRREQGLAREAARRAVHAPSSSRLS